MTQKELLYLEDLINYENQAGKICEVFSKKVETPQLKEHLTSLSTHHKQNVTTLCTLLKDSVKFRLKK